MAKKKGQAKKQKRTVTQGIVNILSTFNNTIINITDPQGNTLTWESGGTVGFKGTRKSTPYAAQLAAQKAARRAIQEYGLQEVEVRIKGAGAGRESALRAIYASGLKIKLIRDVTPIPHNGCRPPSKRRV
ncbi:MAG: 30S ribosomal protein S11 [Hydrogenobacter thermophilus]|uniref:Small ribosomal subunit protein uS11 n=1 Tax=Hydrogenobacter thermophilus (strain DSM 6534 / IAM 12695 / TK-6) TaxID=608538 RepID=D3DH86_HYDTT|nr:30S ribosomal protein S11 [Hydrogenobacter thermophilus]ADO45126.1 30S ribosomal protein S11 [Hydrogenobacter thermophilus TK-6]MCS7284788.1 30S ribosomal protein S11 [Hydrogenobacter thermophilus]BAI69188.1 ribosomal protein S11 [Hydrogenobacter thermophilus TK-6]